MRPNLLDWLKGDFGEFPGESWGMEEVAGKLVAPSPRRQRGEAADVALVTQ